MADNYLITGYHGTPHVTVENDRGINAGIVGEGRFVLPVGERFRAEYIGNNTVRMYDGKLMDNGAAAGIPKGEFVDFQIANAGQGMKRNDLIVFNYAKDEATQVETGSFIVVQGAESSTVAVDPVLTQNDLSGNTALAEQMALWRVCVTGVNISAPVRVAEVQTINRGDTKAEAAKNLLDNSWFFNPVNQRGKATYGGAAGYTIDRWKLSNANGTLSVIYGGIELARTDGGNAYLLQYLGETDREYYGRAYTIAVMTTDGAIYMATGTFPLAPPTSGAELVGVNVPGGRASLYLRSSHSAPYVQLRATDASTPLRLAWAAVYEGAYTASTLPLYAPKGYAAELAECQRYYYRINAQGADSMFAIGFATDTKRADFVIPTPKMRDGVTPTLEFGGNFGFAGRTWEATNNDLTLGACTGQSVHLHCSVSAIDFTIAETLGLRAHNDATAYIALSADL